MFSKIRAALPANRVAAIIAVLTGLGTIITTFVADSGLAGSKTGDAIVAAVGLLGGLILILKTVDKFLEGAQNWDSLMVAGVPKVANAPVAALPAPQGDLSDGALGMTDGDAEAPTNVGMVVNVVEPDPEV